MGTSSTNEENFIREADEETGDGFAVDESPLVSPLVAALREHFAKYYAPTAAAKGPFASRNVVAPPLNLELMNASGIQEMCKTR